MTECYQDVFAELFMDSSKQNGKGYSEPRTDLETVSEGKH